MTDSLLDGGEITFDETKDYLSELVGEGKKYKDAAAVAKAQAHASHHISLLEQEKAELLRDHLALKEEYNSRARLEELIDRMKTNTSSETPPVNVDMNNKPSFDPEQLKSFVNETFEAKTREQRETENYNRVQEKLKEVHGSEYRRILSTQLNDIGLSDEDAVALAKKSPTAFFRQFGLDQQKQTDNFQTPPQTQRKGDTFVPAGATKRTWSYYQNLKKTKPAEYWDPKTQLQKDRDYMTLGKAFEDGDFNRFG